MVCDIVSRVPHPSWPHTAHSRCLVGVSDTITVWRPVRDQVKKVDARKTVLGGGL